MHTSIAETGELLRNRELSSVELTKECLAQIEKLNPTLNAFITVTADSALAQARDADAEIRADIGVDRFMEFRWHLKISLIPLESAPPPPARYSRIASPQRTLTWFGVKECRSRPARQAELARIRLRRQFDGQLLR